MAPLGSTTRALLQACYEEGLNSVSLSEELPRMVRHISIINEDGLPLEWEAVPLVLPEPTDRRGRRAFWSFLHLRRVLLTLTWALEGRERSIQIDEELRVNRDRLPRELFTFLTKQYAPDSLVLRVLTCLRSVGDLPRSAPFCGHLPPRSPCHAQTDGIHS